MPLPARGSSPRSARLLLAVLGLGLSLVLSACGGEADKPDSQPIEGGAKLAALWPLTGEPVEGATPKHPVLVTKIDNTASSRPQQGLGRADLITEEMVEGGVTRLAVFHYSRLPKVVGPVRSMRATDIGIVAPAHGVIVASGAAVQTNKRIKQAGITTFTEGGPGYYRDSGRRAPYNLMVDLPKLAKSVKDEALVPASYLPWGEESDFTGTTRARGIDAVFSRSHTTSWRYAKGRYQNVNGYADPKSKFVPNSVLVLRVRQGDAGYRDPAGNKVPESIYVGKGEMMLFHQGKVVRGTWSKATKQTPVKLRDADGAVQVPAGHVWIELVPVAKDGGRVVIRK